ncbi:type VI secretion protein [Streptomyces sp. NPDC002018]|uniref:type VI secretion protein n=1 Tax=Streptomyces sp. NPDC002018 TaxID=3364629 RepID=UPI0036764A05
MSRHHDGQGRGRGPGQGYEGYGGGGETRGGVPDGLLLGVLGFVLGLSLLVWTATGLAGLFTHGAWPEGVTYGRTPLAMRQLVAAPHDMAGAWPDTPASQLSGYGLFWGLLISQLMVLIVITVFVLGVIARYRAVRARRRELLRDERERQARAQEHGQEHGHGHGQDHSLEHGRAHGYGYGQGYGQGYGYGHEHGLEHQRDQAVSGHATLGKEPVPGVAATTGPGPGSGPVPGTAPGAGASPRTAAAESAPAPETQAHIAHGRPQDRLHAHAEPQTQALPHSPPQSWAAGPSPAAAAAPPSSVPTTPGTGPRGPASPTGLAAGPAGPAGPADPAASMETAGLAALVPVPTGVPAPRTRPRVRYGDPHTRRPASVQAVLDAAGPALVVTSDPTVWAETKDARAKLGPVLLYDPGHLCDTPARLHWSPTAGCENADTAAARATALLAPVRPHALLDAAMADTAETLLRCWLHAAAVDGRPFKQVHRWAQGGSAHEAVRILRTHPKATSGLAGLLESALTAHPERREVAQQLTARALAALSSVHIRDACTPNRTDSLTLDSFVNEGGTLYVVGEPIEDPRSRPGAMPLLTALTSSVVEHGRRMAARSSDGRLDPPMSLVLDDVAAVAPLPQLPEVLATGQQQGLPALVLLRSRQQGRDRWPHADIQALADEA